MASEQKTKIERLNSRLSSLELEYSSFLGHHKELSEYFQPRRGRFFSQDRNRGEKRNSKIINSRGTMALRTATAGLMSGITSPTRAWFGFETIDPGLMEFGPVKEWIDDAETLLREIFNQSNLYNALPTFYTEVLLFGTGFMTHVDDFADVARFYPHTVGSYYLSQNARFVVDTAYRKSEWTTIQLVEEFGLENVSQPVKTAYDLGNYDLWFPVCHAVGPNNEYDPGRQFSKYKKFSSCYFEPGAEDKNKFLREAGFDEFPGYAARWETTGEDIYGTNCPGMTALGDVKQLQHQEKKKAQAIDKLVSPPVKGPGALKNTPVSSLPGSFTASYADADVKLEPIYQIRINLSDLKEDVMAVERRIDEAFYVDLFKAISNMEGIQPRNQLELSQRNEEKLLLLGPVLERLHGEVLKPLVDRTFEQAVRAGLFRPPPQELSGVPLKIRFISTLAQAQMAVATQKIDRVAAFVGGVATLDPSVVKKFDAHQAVDEYARSIGAPARVVRADDLVQGMIAAEQKQQQAMQMAAMANSAADTAQKMSKADMGTDNVLTRTSKALAAGGVGIPGQK